VEASRGVLDAACFPMVPFCNRLVPPDIAIDGRVVTISRLVDAWASQPIHGLGWCSPWRVRTFDASRAVLQHAHDGSVWPWAYEAEQAFTLTPASLTVVLRLQNQSPDPMPFGLGFHPYFPKPAGTRLQTTLDGRWATDPVPVPRDWHPLEGPDRFDEGRVLDDAALDHCFTGWNGRARIDWPGSPFAITLEASANAPFLQVYAPPGQPFFCLEPMTQVPNDLSGHRLAAGESGSVQMRISLTPRQRS
jgi:aldose 1-epimerase